ncbi:MAG TPA: transglutaminase-like domain-containing protein [Acidimicrobiales bacterium]|nr:transglutaminase-like domain-containing protein [Acidimicrobiales bacterium]
MDPGEGAPWQPTERFAELVNRPEDVLAKSLDEAALLVAAHARPGLELDVDAYLSRLDDLAAACAAPVLEELLTHLFLVEGFRGNTHEYYDPRNSYLDEVLDRRLGIPLTLGVVLIEVGRRLGIELAGVAMPRHFMVRLPGEPVVLIDPFDGGRIMTGADCEARFRATTGGDVPFDPAYLEPVGPVAILRRMLANLRQIHASRRDSLAVEWVLRLRSFLPGGTPEEESERAGVLVALARFDEAADVLEGMADEAPAPRAGQLAAQARRLRARLN